MTLTGPGGVGKTALALAAAGALVRTAERTVVFVDLAPIHEPGLVLATIARSLCMETPSQAESELARSLRQLLQDWSATPLLLVLDNFEQVRAAGGALTQVLPSSGEVQVLATSRGPLHVSDEWVLEVPPLALPVAEAGSSLDATTIGRSPAAALFVQRAQLADPCFSLDVDNAEAIAEICLRLDGLPLAIELAAAWVTVFSPGDLLPRLKCQLDRARHRLARGQGQRPARHETLRTTIAWSEDLLNEEERKLFRRMAVFVRGWTLEAAERVGAEVKGSLPSESDPRVATTLAELVDRGLVVAETVNRERRFRMLETVREYALDALALQPSECREARQRHLAYFVDFVERAALHRQGSHGEQQRAWLDQIECEYENARAARTWAATAPDPELGLRLAIGLAGFWTTRGPLVEGDAWLEDALRRADAALARGDPRPLRARALQAGADLAWRRGQPDRAADFAARSLSHWNTLKDVPGYVQSLVLLAGAALNQGDHARADALLRVPLALLRTLGASARETLMLCLLYLAQAAHGRGQYDRALAWLDQQIALARDAGARASLAAGLAARALVVVEARAGWAEADGLLGEALDHAEALGHVAVIAHCLDQLAWSAAAAGCTSRAATLLGAADRLLEQSGDPLYRPWRPSHERALAATREALGAAFATAWQAGRALSMPEALVIARTADPAPGREVDHTSRAHSGAPDEVKAAALTPRQREIAALIAAGLTDRQIADALVITEGTAGIHVRNILRRLGARNRAQVAAWTARHSVRDR